MIVTFKPELYACVVCAYNCSTNHYDIARELLETNWWLSRQSYNFASFKEGLDPWSQEDYNDFRPCLNELLHVYERKESLAMWDDFRASLVVHFL
jgi:hypothetical protein